MKVNYSSGKNTIYILKKVKMKKYRYIWKDKAKQWWIATQTWTMYTVWSDNRYMITMKEMIENEDCRQEIKEEDVFEKIWNKILETRVREKNNIDWKHILIKTIIRNHIGITKEELDNITEDRIDCWLIWYIRVQDIIDLLKNKWLLLD